MENKNIDVLDSFVTYCNEHPDERFWQALRNWSGYSFIYGSSQPRAEIQARGEAKDVLPLEDTFYKEGK